MKLDLGRGGAMKKGMIKRDGCFENETPMKRDRGFETCPDNPTDKLRGTESPAHK